MSRCSEKRGPEEIMAMRQDLPELGALQRVPSLRENFTRVLFQVLDPLQDLKREYDESGDKNKTPFALADFTDPKERDAIFEHINAFSSTHGCTGACKGCGVNAFLLGKKNLDLMDVVSLEQQKHFIDELITFCHQNSLNPADRIRGMVWYDANDPLDDPNIVEVLSYMYERTGGVPFISTVASSNGKEKFVELAKYAMEHRKFEYLQLVFAMFVRFKSFFVNDFTINSFEDLKNLDLLSVEDQVESLNLLKNNLTNYKALASIPLDISVPIIKKFLNDLDRAKGFKISNTLKVLNLGSLEDYFDCNLESIEKINNALGRLVNVKDGKCVYADEFNRNHVLQKMIKDYIRMFYDLKHFYLEDNESFDGFCEFHASKNKDSIADLLILVEEVLLMSDLDMQDIKFDEYSLKLLRAKMEEYSKSLSKNRAPRVIMRLSDLGKNPDLIERHGKDLWFAPEDRRGSNMRLLGSANVSKGEGNFDEDSIACFHEFTLTPFGLYNSVAGKVTVDFPQGRCLVAFGGFKENPEEIQAGDKLLDILKNVVVHKTSLFNNRNTCFVFDGLRNMEVRFDTKTYEVASCSVVPNADLDKKKQGSSLFS